MYILIYRYGVHMSAVCCSKEDFFAVIDELSKEFKIIKIPKPDSSMNYYVVNYHGDLDIIGCIHDVSECTT